MPTPSTIWNLARSWVDFLRPFGDAESTDLLRRSLAERERSFLRVVERAIYENERSPYAKLVRAAGIEFEEITAWVETEGLEDALQKLYHREVFITLEEFKGLRPVERFGFELKVSDRDFDNPLANNDFVARTGGSSGTRRRVVIDLEDWRAQAAAQYLFMESNGLLERPVAIWRPFCPGAVGLEKLYVYSKIGCAPERWFSHSPFSWRRESWQFHGLRIYMAVAARLWGIDRPELLEVPLDAAITVARWLADQVSAGRPAYLDTNVGSGMRVLLAAREANLDLSDTFFRFGSEPYTPTKARLVAEMGCRAVCHYITTEAGAVGIACTDAQTSDDVHLMSGSIAIVQNPASGRTGEIPNAFYLTSLTTSTPKLLLNVEYGDYGVLESRRCGCRLGALGFEQHVHTIRSYEKLTTEGNHFLGKHLIDLVERALPSAFGGGPTDYQLVESEEDGLTRVGIVAHPRLGPLEESKVIEVALDHLRRLGNPEASMSEIWRDADTLRLLRREPYATPQSKILPLHSLH